MQKENRIRYAEMFEVSYSSFIKFNKHLDIPFSDIDVAWLKRYEMWMKKQNLSVSTISTRIRHLRAVFNLAITEHSIKNDCYPFHSYKVSKLNKRTAKRALSKQDILKIMQYKGKSPMERFAIDSQSLYDKPVCLPFPFLHKDGIQFILDAAYFLLLSSA